MRYFRMFLLHLQYAFELRSLSVVWFLISFVNASFLLLFWWGSFRSEGMSFGGMTISSITTYYLLLMIASAFLVCHADEDIANRDIKQGFLVSHLLHPFSYFQTKLLEEIPWRLIQGFLGVLVFVGYMIFLHFDVRLTSGWSGIIAAIVIIFFAYCVSFVWSMIMGLLALWVTEYNGIHELSTVVTLVLAGYVVPVEFLPSGVRSLAQILPFSYMIYYPIRAVQGTLSFNDVVRVIGVQILWLAIFLFCYGKIWKSGIKRFTGVGQ